MALHNFEEQAGKKLRKRQITPSAESWEKLESKLETKKEDKNFRMWWPLLAAMVMLAFLAGNLFFRTTPETPSIVEEPTEKIQEKTPEIEEFEEPVQLASEEKRTNPVQNKKVESTEDKSQPPNRKNNQEELIAATADSEKLHFELENLSIQPPLEENAPLKGNLEETIASVVSEHAGRDLKEAEVDALLLEAAGNITRRENFVNNESLSASALLADVEAEIDQSFRQKIFELLKEGYAEARYAFVNRNN